jgi:hypothetical protein
MDFAPLEYVIPGYVEGLTVLGGKPKLGKSWWAYDASIAVATGGKAMGAVATRATFSTSLLKTTSAV